MAFQVFQSNQNQIKMTDDVLIYDKDKFVDLKELLMVRMTDDRKVSFLLIGQSHPSSWMTYLAYKQDDLVTALLNHEKVEVVDKTVVEGTSASKWDGYLNFDDGTSFYWYRVADGHFFYFKSGEEKIEYDYIPLRFQRRDFQLLEERKYPPKAEINKYVVKFDPWGDNKRHFELSLKHLEKFGASAPSPLNESPLKRDPLKMMAGCIFIVAIAFVLFFIFIIVLN